MEKLMSLIIKLEKSQLSCLEDLKLIQEQLHLKELLNHLLGILDMKRKLMDHLDMNSGCKYCVKFHLVLQTICCLKQERVFMKKEKKKINQN